MHRGLGMGVLGALALLAACSAGNTEPEDAGAGSEDGDGETAEDGVAMDVGSEMTCSWEAYFEDHPWTTTTAIGQECLPPIGGECVCDEECMTMILSSECPYTDCSFNPDMCGPIYSGCYDVMIACTERVGDECCFWVVGKQDFITPGRPLREAGVPVLPELRVLDECPDAASASRAADAYREFARFESASVAAFLEAAAFLRALGAPATLVDAHERAAVEEARHAELALAAAEAMDGRVAMLVDFARAKPRDVTAEVSQARIEQFLVDLIRDGCIGEHLAAFEAAWSAERVDAPALAAYWQPLVREEASHAALAWATLEWLLATYPNLHPLAQTQLTRTLHAYTQRAHENAAREPAQAHRSVPNLGLPNTTDRRAIHAAALAALQATASACLAAA